MFIWKSIPYQFNTNAALTANDKNDSKQKQVKSKISEANFSSESIEELSNIRKPSKSLMNSISIWSE